MLSKFLHYYDHENLIFHQDISQGVFWHAERATGAVLKVIDGWLTLTVFLENITSWACLERPVLKFIFHFYAQWETFFRPLSSWLAEILGSYRVENNDVSFANSFTVDCHFQNIVVPVMNNCLSSYHKTLKNY